MSILHHLGTRERVFVIGAGAVLLLGLLYTLVIDPWRAASIRLDQQIVVAQRELQELQTLRQEYHRKKSAVDRIHAQLTQQHNFSLLSQLEALATQTGTRHTLRAIQLVASPPNKTYDEEAVEIKMDDVLLEPLIAYLFAIENAPQWMRVTRLSIQPRPANRQLLSVICRVSTFTPKEGTSSLAADPHRRKG
jgi:type II secretory pathway component PulM